MHVEGTVQVTSASGTVIKADEGVLDERGMLDIARVRPFFYVPEAQFYYGTGSLLGGAFSIGKTLKG